MTQGVLKTHGICLMMYFKKIIGMLVHFFYFMDILEEKNHIYIYIYIYIDFQTCMNIYIRLIIYSSFYLFKYSTNKHHRKLCIYTHRI